MNVNRGSLRTIIAVAALGLGGAAALTVPACTTDDNDPGATTGTGGAGGGTDGGLGGTPGTGGGGGGGAGGSLPPDTACLAPIVVPASRPGITNFDAYDGVSDLSTWNSPLGGDSASGQYAGPFGYGDRANDRPETFELTAGHESTYSMRVADTLAQNYGGGMGTWLSACLNATAFSGISFWVRGNTPTGKSTLTLSMQETLSSTRAKPTDAIGTCAGVGKECAHPTFVFDVTNTWTKIEAPWASFVPGLAKTTPVTPNGRNVIQVQWSADLVWGPNDAGTYVPTPAPYELVVDTIAFY